MDARNCGKLTDVMNMQRYVSFWITRESVVLFCVTHLFLRIMSFTLEHSKSKDSVFNLPLTCYEYLCRTSFTAFTCRIGLLDWKEDLKW